MLQALAGLMVFGLSVYPAKGRSGYVSLLMLSLPLVASLNFYLGYPMRWVAAEMAAGFWRLWGWDVIRQGVLLVDGGKMVGVDPACAGVAMLWTGLFTAAVLAAWQQCNLVRTLSWLGAAWVIVIAGNVLRVIVLFLPESGRMHWPHWTHEAVGMGCYGLMLAGIFAWGNLGEMRKMKRLPKRGRATGNLVWMGLGRARVTGLMLLVLVSAVTWIAYAAKAPDGLPSLTPEQATWPATLNGSPLVPLPLTQKEASFLSSFPGEVGRFRAGDAEVILRKVNRATRLLHSSADCLRASGYAIQSPKMLEDEDGRRWQMFVAQSATERFTVRERIVSATGQTYTDVSAWFWNASLGDAGPWLAVTISEGK